jgi:glycosyltransferase involved in cell wall biosynthesis
MNKTNLTLSLAIPAYNEEKSLRELVSKVLSVDFGEIKTEIVIINDGSKDKTWEVMSELQKENPEKIKIFQNEKNSGKSQTVKNAILKTTGDIVVIQDADLEYDPVELKDLLDLMQKENLDVVFGNRFGKKNKVIYWQNFIGNISLSFFSNLFTFWRIKKWIPDMEVCYKMIQGDIAREIAATIVSKSTFGLEPEITAKLAKYKKNGKHLKFGFVPISYFPRSVAEGKKMRAIEDGIKALREIITFNL